MSDRIAGGSVWRARQSVRVLDVVRVLRLGIVAVGRARCCPIQALDIVDVRDIGFHVLPPSLDVGRVEVLLAHHPLEMGLAARLGPRRL